MAETSILWNTGTTGDGVSAYTQAKTVDAFRDLFISDNFATQGVLLGNAGELAVTGTSSPVVVSSGAAVVYGFLYRNTAAVNVAVSTPVVGTTAHRIVLRADYSAQTVRIVLKSATDGINTPPALTQTANTTWEISLATLSITTGGVITVTDARSFAHYPTAVATENLDASAVTTAKIADANVTLAKLAADSVNASKIVDGSVGTSELANDSVDDTKVGNRVPQVYRRQGGSATNWWTGGTSTQTPGAVRMQMGTISLGNQGAGSGGTGSVTFPTAFSDVPFVMIMGSPYFVEAGLQRTGTTVATPTTTGFNYEFSNEGGSTVAAYLVWLAIGPE